MTDNNEEYINNPSPVEQTTAGPVLSSAWYNRLKWFTLIFLPALSSLYFGISQILHLPYATEVVGVAALLATFLGVILGISGNNYTKSGADGNINARIEGNEVILSSLSLPNIAPEELVAKKRLILQVNSQ